MLPHASVYLQVTGWSCVALLLLLVIRGFAGNTWRWYPAFYVYVTHTLLTTAIGLSVSWKEDTYRTFYWVNEVITGALGVAVTWEIYRRVLEHYPGVRRMAGMLLFVTFVLVLLLSATSGVGESSFTRVSVNRDLRTAFAMVLLILFALVAYYGVLLGKNIRGIAIGYIFGIATAALNLSLRYYLGRAFDPFWTYVRPIEFLAGLVIWCVTLWSYQPAPAPPNQDMERDYEWMSGQAVHAMVRLRTHLIHPDGS